MLLQAVNLTGYRLIRRTLYMLWFKFIIGLILYSQFLSYSIVQDFVNDYKTMEMTVKLLLKMLNQEL